MKRIISILLCVVLAISLVTCNNDTTGDASNSKPASGTAVSSDESSASGSSEAQTSSVPSVVPAVNDYQKMTYNFVEITDYFHITGRTAVGTSTEATGSKQGMVYDHATQGLLFKADCEGDITVTLALSIRAQDTCHYYTVYIDGVEQERVAVSGTPGSEQIVKLPVATELKRGVHSIEVYRNHESLLGIATLLSVTMNGVPEKWSEDENKLKIEFLGDSITSGTGVYGVNGANDQSNIKYYDGTASYAFIASRILNAEASIVSRSGMTIAGDTGTPNMYNYYNYLSYARDKNTFYDNTKMDVDLYVISLGANDTNSKYNHSAEKITADVKAALTAVRKDHPNTKILWVYGQLTKSKEAAIKTAITEMGGEASGFYYYCCTKSNVQGSSYHPNAEAQQRDGEEVAAYIKQILN